ncbi:MAG TPA: hypothetical protein DEA80_16200 [Afipia sp.]|uniref:Uncharacterized protein n=1 Tax=Afipia broomeae ATCC 49717 TaxID=883078 RepID=K8PII5_9BRAD|nr:hypothetical protein [Afipia broomeae]MAH67670.1 hypothetical protein [Afipia sp.]OUX63223.1 MAG: hypothetical protein CBB64_00300 [Afipia sp. TMED4]EKS41326.1 hypothetical protein HMPREF9695_00418 [Afipia broomeae ATCC 49717]HAP12515.1 hypothetical protein [Afipia sp.]HBR46438.1 hypothetical protein [Afipia sp.]
MTDTPEHHVVAALVSEVRAKLEEAHSIAQAAEICARAGNVSRSVQILMDFEGLAHEAQDLFRAALAIKRSLLDETA